MSATTIRTLLLGNGLRSAPRRASVTWRGFLRAQASGIVATDFFVVETVRLTTLYVLFFIELEMRQVRLAGVTRCPNGPWVVQRARERSVEQPEGTSAPRFLIRDRDSKFTRAFDDVFGADGTQVITTLGPGAERQRVRRAVGADGTRRVPGLDADLGRRHRERVLDEYVRHYNDQRPHRGLRLRPPSGSGIESTPTPSVVAAAGRVRRRDRLGGLVHEYYQAAA